MEPHTSDESRVRELTARVRRRELPKPGCIEQLEYAGGQLVGTQRMSLVEMMFEWLQCAASSEAVRAAIETLAVGGTYIDPGDGTGSWEHEYQVIDRAQFEQERCWLETP